MMTTAKGRCVFTADTCGDRGRHESENREKSGHEYHPEPTRRAGRQRGHQRFAGAAPLIHDGGRSTGWSPDYRELICRAVEKQGTSNDDAVARRQDTTGTRPLAGCPTTTARRSNVVVSSRRRRSCLSLSRGPPVSAASNSRSCASARCRPVRTCPVGATCRRRTPRCEPALFGGRWRRRCQSTRRVRPASVGAKPSQRARRRQAAREADRVRRHQPRPIEPRDCRFPPRAPHPAAPPSPRLPSA
jgi:hypothetical protein